MNERCLFSFYIYNIYYKKFIKLLSTKLYQSYLLILGWERKILKCHDKLGVAERTLSSCGRGRGEAFFIYSLFLIIEVRRLREKASKHLFLFFFVVMACLGTTVTATGTTAKRIAYPRGLSSINTNLRPSGSFSLLPPLPQLSTSTRLSNGNVSSGGRGRGQVLLITRAEANTMTSIEKSGIKIIKNPPESKLADLGVRSWPKYVYSLLEFIFSFQSATAILLLLLIFLVLFLSSFFFFSLFQF